ncbi:hypothetical protein MCEMSEM22_01203 [Comamonadaceae bacterium]
MGAVHRSSFAGCRACGLGPRQTGRWCLVGCSRNRNNWLCSLAVLAVVYELARCHVLRRPQCVCSGHIVRRQPVRAFRCLCHHRGGLFSLSLANCKCRITFRPTRKHSSRLPLRGACCVPVAPNVKPHVAGTDCISGGGRRRANILGIRRGLGDGPDRRRSLARYRRWAPRRVGKPVHRFIFGSSPILGRRLRIWQPTWTQATESLAAFRILSMGRSWV